jgi:NADH-quinone oxidoreductase subunit J
MLVTVFFILATLCFLCALTLVFHRNPMVAGVAMAGAMICLGGLFILLHVPFLGFFQILVYAGAVMVIMLYVIMALGQEEAGPQVGTAQTVMTWAAALLLLWKLVSEILRSTGNTAFTSQVADWGSIQHFGTELVDRYAVPFEVASLLLVGAMVGAIILSRRRWV